MFEEALLLYFNPFYFSNGNNSKPKYFIVLRVIENMTVLATLPSSQDYVPSQVSIHHGCVDIPEICFNAYIFEAGVRVCENGWAFPKNTFAYGQQLGEYEISNLTDIYPIEGIDYKIIGKLTNKEYTSLLKCLADSPNVKRKYRRILTI